MGNGSRFSRWLPGVCLLLLNYKLVQAQYDPESHSGTTENIQEVFEGRCWDYEITRYLTDLPRVETDCEELWDKFFSSFSYQPPCALSIDSYTPFLDAAKQTVPKDKALFWSGVFTLAHRYGAQGQRYVTLEDTLIGYLADSITWCGQSIDPGMNMTRCPAWDDCPLEATESFWAGASRTFASETSGEVHLIVDGSNPDKPAYRKDSFFGKYELPNLGPDVTSVIVIVSHQLEKPKLEECGTGSLVDLHTAVVARGKRFVCVDDPLAVMHLLCSDDPLAKECLLAINHKEGRLSEKPRPYLFNSRHSFD